MVSLTAAEAEGRGAAPVSPLPCVRFQIAHPATSATAAAAARPTPTKVEVDRDRLPVAPSGLSFVAPGAVSCVELPAAAAAAGAAMGRAPSEIFVSCPGSSGG